MDVIESWQDHNNKIYAVVKHSEKDQKDFLIKEYEAMWLGEAETSKTDLFSFGGSVGYRIADFDNVEEVEEYKNIPVIFYAFNGFILGDSSIFLFCKFIIEIKN